MTIRQPPVAATSRSISSMWSFVRPYGLVAPSGVSSVIGIVAGSP